MINFSCSIIERSTTTIVALVQLSMREELTVLFPLQNLPVIHSSVITRCRSCRTYINPFVTFTDSRRWRCPMCFRVNEGMHCNLLSISVQLSVIVIRLSSDCLSFLWAQNPFVFVLVPEEFCFDPVTRQYGDPSKRPEVRNATVEFIAPSEYMVISLKWYESECLESVDQCVQWLKSSSPAY